MEDIDDYIEYDEMMQCTKQNNAGGYEIIRGAVGVQTTDSRLYYRTYLPASIQQVDEQQFLTKEWGDRLNSIYREIGKMEGLGFYETNFKVRNRQFFRQESVAVIRKEDVEVHLTEVFSLRLSADICKKMVIYEYMEEQRDCICGNVLKGKIKISNKDAALRQNQIWENTEFKKEGVLVYSPPSPEHIPELMRDLEGFWNEKTKMDIFIKAGLMAYQFLTIMPYEENNEIWLSVLLNYYLKLQGIEIDYYIPYAKYLIEQDVERKRAMRQVRESGDYGKWIRFFLDVLEMAVTKTNQAIMQLEQIHKNTLASIENEKQKSLLQEVSAFMEENPVFVIHDIEREFHTAYNTAAKSVAILEKHDLVKEISNKQRYRVYCYEQYLKEIIK